MTESVVLPPDPGTHHMQDYRAYIIGKDGRIASAVGFVSESDPAAIESAKRLVNGHDVELWQAARKIATFKHEE